MCTQVSIAAAKAAVVPSAFEAPVEMSRGSGVAIAVALLLLVGCVVGVGVGWWYVAEQRRIQRCRHLPSRPAPEAPLTMSDSTLASRGFEHLVARPRSPRQSVTNERFTTHGGGGSR